MKKQIMMVFGLLSIVAASAGASELDPQMPVGLPQGLIVRENAQGQKEVFKSSVAVKSDADALVAIQKDVSSETQVKNVAESQSAGELDRVSSDQSWCFWWNTGRYSYYPTYSYHYNYSAYTYVNYYYPSYNYSYGGYRYSYYYPRYNYCYRY